MRQNDPEFDSELEQALAVYADPADAGHPQQLSAGVLARVADARKQRRRWKLIFIFVVPEFAFLLLWIAFLSLHHPPAAHLRFPQLAAEAVPPAPGVVLPQTGRTREHPRPPAVPAVSPIQKQKSLPKLDHFPAPSPLTDQEKLLVAFTTRVPAHVQQSVAKAQQQAGEPLHIAELSIPPIDPETQPNTPAKPQH